MKIRLIPGLLFSLIIFLFSSSAMAHTKLVQTFPNNGEKVDQVTEVKLDFTESILPVSTFQVKNQQNDVIPFSDFIAKGKELSGKPGQPLPPNHYTVEWKAAAEDGHISNGTFSFEVGQQASNETPNTGTAPVPSNINVNPKSESQSQPSHGNAWVMPLVVVMVLLVGFVVWFAARGKNRQ